jgi:cell division septum initiation protein DivIVA
MHGTREDAASVRPPFEIVLRGFDRQQVIDHVNALKSRVAAIGAERDAALQRAAELSEQVDRLRQEATGSADQVQRLRQELAEMGAEVERLQRSPVSAVTARIQRMLQMAEEEAAELRKTVELEVRSAREEARAEAERLLAETTQRCEQLEAESARRRESAEAESAARLAQAQQECEQSIARREAQLQQWAREYQAATIAALHLLMRLAGERLSSRVEKASRQVTALRRVRDEISAQLLDVHHLLTEAVEVVDQPTAAEQAESPDEPDGAGLPELLPDGGDSAAPRPPQQWEPGPLGRPWQSDQPTAKYGLRP